MQAELGTDLAVEEFKRGKHGGCKASPSLDWDVSRFSLPSYSLRTIRVRHRASLAQDGRVVVSILKIIDSDNVLSILTADETC